MRIGLIGAGNMAHALARGLGEPVVVCDAGSGRAAELAREVGGTAVPGPVEVAREADVVVLCHKPPGLGAVAAEAAPDARAVLSVLAATPLAALRAAYPEAAVVRLMPNVPVELGRGVVALAAEEDRERALVDEVRPLLERLGAVVEVPDRLVDVAMAVASCGTAFLALVAEAQADSAVRRGLPAATAAELALEGMAGAAALMRARGGDFAAVRREVTSPGGSTARGLAALERTGVRGAFHDAMDAVVGA
jgi:pyrroline-5-carboxylate reductase